MANTLAPLAPDIMASDVQEFLNAMLVARPIANMKFRSNLVDGDQIDWPRFNQPRVQAYTASTDVTIDATTAVSDVMNINLSRIADFNVDPTEVRQARFKGFPEMLARQAAFVLGQEMDQSCFAQIRDRALLTRGTAGVPLTLSVGTIFAEMANAKAELASENATDGALFALLDPHRISILAQSEVANGFNKADVTLENGFRGGSATGFQVFETNNLPTSVGLTVDTQPTAADTVTIAGVTWTIVADGTATAAGEISREGDLGAFQTNFINAINGTGTAGAGTYIDVAAEDRRRLQNKQVSASAFAANVTTITAFGRQNNSETFTAATNIFGTETMNLLFGRFGAIGIGMQTEPNVLITQETRNLSKNYLVHTLYGRRVFDRDRRRSLNMTIDAA